MDAEIDSYKKEIKAAIDDQDEDALIRIISNNREKISEDIDIVS